MGKQEWRVSGWTPRHLVRAGKSRSLSLFWSVESGRVTSRSVVSPRVTVQTQDELWFVQADVSRMHQVRGGGKCKTLAGKILHMLSHGRRALLARYLVFARIGKSRGDGVLDEGDWIEEFVSAGAKNYGYRARLGHICTKVKGFSLNVRGRQQLNFQVLKDNVMQEMIHRRHVVTHVHNPVHFVRDPVVKKIRTKPQKKRINWYLTNG